MFLRFLQVAARTALEFVFLLGLLVHLFQKYLLNTYYVLGSVLDDGRTVNKRGKSLHGGCILVEIESGDTHTQMV